MGTIDGSRLAIRLLQEAAERGDLDPWDVDVIAVVDGFLDQLQVRMALPRLASGHGGSYEQDLAESSEAFLAASVLVALKARILEQHVLPLEANGDEEDVFEDGSDLEAADESEPMPRLPLHAEDHLRRRLVAAPPLQRPVTLGELIRSLEATATQLEQQDATSRSRSRPRAFSRRHAMAQVAALAHREKLPETTAALDRFLDHWADGGGTFEGLVCAWAQAAPEDLDRDRVGVFWALLFLCSQGRVDLHQEQGLYGPLTVQVLPRAQARQAVEAVPGRVVSLRMAPPRAAQAGLVYIQGSQDKVAHEGDDSCRWQGNPCPAHYPYDPQTHDSHPAKAGDGISGGAAQRARLYGNHGERLPLGGTDRRVFP